MSDLAFDRRHLKRVAEDVMSDDTRRYTSTPSRVSAPELVRCMREAEAAAYDAYTDRETEVTHDFALGMWTAFAAIRYDFAIQDEALVDTGRDDGPE